MPETLAPPQKAALTIVSVTSTPDNETRVFTVRWRVAPSDDRITSFTARLEATYDNGSQSPPDVENVPGTARTVALRVSEIVGNFRVTDFRITLTMNAVTRGGQRHRTTVTHRGTVPPTD